MQVHPAAESLKNIITQLPKNIITQLPKNIITQLPKNILPEQDFQLLELMTVIGNIIGNIIGKNILYGLSTVLINCIYY